MVRSDRLELWRTCTWLGVLCCSACDRGIAGEASVPVSQVVQAVTCDVKLARYPVMGRHNNGYDSTAGDHSQWSCGDAHSNSDFIGGDHLGNDIWAEAGAPVVATVAGRLTLTGFSDYSGNKVTIVDDCGWYHFYAHLQSIAPGKVDGVRVQPGDVVGAVGNTGTASNGVVHLHYSIYPDGNYDAGIDPWPALHAVEQNVCAGGPAFAGSSLGRAGQSYPIVADAAVTVALGETVTGWVKLTNMGEQTWQPDVVRLAPIPRDQASPFHSPSWISETRISSVKAAVAPGQVGEFALDITGSALGESLLQLGWVAENVTWFADSPQGGGPPDGYFAVRVAVVEGEEPTAVDAGGGSGDPAPDAGDRSGAGATGGAARDAGLGAGRGSADDDDAGSETDAGERDAGAHGGADGGASAGTTDDSSGCQLRTVRPRSASALWLLSALLLYAVARRRRGAPT
jgi:murein DD-endopeptidase MepM/ murein hydrolase activator NlpD